MAERAHEHGSKLAGVRGDELVGHPMVEDDDALVTVWVGVSDLTDGEIVWEGLLARRDGDMATIWAVPHWAYDLGVGDEVTLLDSAEGAPVVTGRLRDGGAYGFRVFFGEEHPPYSWQRLMKTLEPYGCWFDPMSQRYVALSAPPEHVEAVAGLLAEAETRGELDYESIRTV